MNWKNLKIGYKIGSGFFILVLLSAIIGILSFINMGIIQKETKSLSFEYIPSISESFQLEKNWKDVVQYADMYDRTGDQFYLKKQKARMEKFGKAIENLIEITGKSENLKARLALFVDLQTNYKQFTSILAEYEKLNISYSESLKGMELIMTKLAVGSEIFVSTNTYERMDMVVSKIYTAINKEQPARLRSVERIVENLERDYSGARNSPSGIAINEFIESSKNFLKIFPQAKVLQLKRMELSGNMMWDIKGTSDVGLDKVIAMGQSTNQILKKEKLVMSLSVLFVVILGSGLVYVLTTSITKPIRKGINLAAAIADGDLSQSIDIDRKDEVGELVHALNQVTQNLRDIVVNLSDNSKIIADSSSLLNSTAEAISDGTKQQAAAVEEVSSSMEEMYANILQSSDNAKQTEKIAVTSVVEITKSKDSFKLATESLQDITNKVSIINDISFQTNLLALNAAVEAARAGEHGRGFAVVAQEVRKLADKSKLAATEINDVSNATMIMSRTARRELDSLVPEIEKTATLVKEITLTSLEQVTGVEQINNAVQQLNIVVQENAERADIMASQSQKLSGQASKMRQLIKTFKL